MANPDLILQAPAKLNLFLHVIGKRKDGYHNLQSVFQLIDFCDELTFTRRDDAQISLDSTINVHNEKNLICCAANALNQYANVNYGAHITLNKHIPIGGGLGGGSSDAAATLLGLNKLWGLNLSISELAKIGVSLGADVPVFVHGRSAFAQGIGEQLTPMDLPLRYYVLVIPPVHVLTKTIFDHPELPRETPSIQVADYQEGFGHNDCEMLVRQLYPLIDEAFRLLNKFGRPRLSGTGSCVFIVCENKTQAEEIAKLIPKPFASAVTHGINISPAHMALEDLTQ